MKFTYAYKTSDGVRHEAAMDAESREAVFESLRARGIRAIKVVAADGSKANGETREKEEARRKKEEETGKKGKVWYAGAAAVLLLFALFVFFADRSDKETQADDLNASPRHQIYGDPVTTEGFERGEFGEVLPRQGDQMLAWFSQPGRLTCPKSVDYRSIIGGRGAAALPSGAFEGYAAQELARERDVAIAADDPREVRELKQIVNGMRQEMRE